MKNLLSQNSGLVHELAAKLDEFATKNTAFKEGLELYHEQQWIDAAVSEFLKQLGYLD